ERRRRAERGEPRVEVALHAVLQIHGAVLVLAAALVGARALTPEQEVVLRIGVDDTRDVRRIDDDGALRFQHCDRLLHRFLLIVGQAAPGVGFSRWREALVVERARDADPRAAEAVAIEEPRVVAARRWRARP